MKVAFSLHVAFHVRFFHPPVPLLRVPQSIFLSSLRDSVHSVRQVLGLGGLGVVHVVILVNARKCYVLRDVLDMQI